MSKPSLWACGWKTAEGVEHVLVFDVRGQAEGKAEDLKTLGLAAVVWNLCGG